MDEWTGTRRRAPSRGTAPGARRRRPRADRAPCEPLRYTVVTTRRFADLDLTVDRALADIAGSFRFLLDVTPVDLVERPRRVLADRTHAGVPVPATRRRPRGDHGAARTTIPVNDVEDPTVAHLLQAKHRELLLLLQMLSFPRHERLPRPEHRSVRRGGPHAAAARRRTILEQVPRPRPTPGRGSMPTHSRSSRRPSSTVTARSRPTSSPTWSCGPGAPG